MNDITFLECVLSNVNADLKRKVNEINEILEIKNLVETKLNEVKNK